MSEAHANSLLASCRVCTVERCAECNVIHLHFGATSVRFKPAAFVMLCETLLSALSQVAPGIVHVVYQHGEGKVTPSH